MEGFRIAITGTPATGKTTVAQLLADSTILTVRDLATEHGCVDNSESDEQLTIIDVDRLSDILKNLWATPSDSNVFIEGHLSHHLPVDAIAVLRCRPTVLEARMSSRGWPDGKIRDNFEWELMGGPWSEISDNKLPIIEIDSTIAGPDQIADEIRGWIDSGFEPPNQNRIDWMIEQHN
tara:strand:+ start:88 stop:621 length:534 start_codon:yes stop_codon:yes gene_type:complete